MREHERERRRAMNRLWILGGLMAVLSAGNYGCYLDQLQAEQRANRVLQTENERARADLADAENLNKQKDTQISALHQELGAKNETVASMSAENTKLRDSLASAEDILKKMAGKPGTGSITIMRTALPEKLSNALQELANRHPGMLEFDPKTGAVRWKADLLFPLGSDAMSTNPELLQAMKEFADIVNSPEAASMDCVIVGHTCNTPIKKRDTLQEHKTNWHLSTHRAISVMNLLGQDGVTMSRMGVMGYGELRPIADNSTPEGKSKNRRVEIFLVQKDAVQSLDQRGVYQSAENNLNYAKPTEVASPPVKVEKKPAKSAHKAPAKPKAD
jgi:chemotaxis protein MotB